MAEEKPHLIAEMKSQIEGVVKEHEKIAEGKAAFDAKKPEMFKEIAEKSKEHEKVVEGKAAFDAKKPDMF